MPVSDFAGVPLVKIMITFDDEQIRDHIYQSLKADFDHKLQENEKEWRGILFLASFSAFILGIIAGGIVGLFVFGC